ncbi:VOC family protein [Hydrogenophaga sp. SL48]|uniref:VOC family protein n=1 Tax=Hydrogenophaga sp. SL48 TaxID=2806347 RepID=UPI001F1A9778|nr:VOC family protein [Hydrogenophaga sp. SL48]UJW79834.1 VOC family protein [Hydrogenophaga sp. SL48]
MTPHIHTCLWFDTQAEEAAAFYGSVFPGSRITGVLRYGPGEPMPEGSALLVSLELDGHALSLLNGGPHYRLSPAASLAVRCADQAEVDRCWAALSAVPEAEMCGWLVDRYGVSWQIVPSFVMERLAGPPGPGVQRMTAAMRQMRKLDIAALERAYAGEP